MLLLLSMEGCKERYQLYSLRPNQPDIVWQSLPRRSTPVYTSPCWLWGRYGPWFLPPGPTLFNPDCESDADISHLTSTG